MRATNNTSPLDSSGSTADSYVSDTTLSTISSSSRDETTSSIDLIESGMVMTEHYFHIGILK